MNEFVKLATKITRRVDAIESQIDGEIAPLFIANMAALAESRALLECLSDDHYTASCSPAFLSYIGAHFRHLLEHYQCLISQCNAGNEQVFICYDTRPRDTKLEQSRVYALAVIDQLSSELCALQKRITHDVECIVRDQTALGSVASTLARELLFLQSHTIHHHAIIGAMCRMHGCEVEEGFGVSIATQAFQAAQTACSQSIAATDSVEAAK